MLRAASNRGVGVPTPTQADLAAAGSAGNAGAPTPSLGVPTAAAAPRAPHQYQQYQPAPPRVGQAAADQVGGDLLVCSGCLSPA